MTDVEYRVLRLIEDRKKNPPSKQELQQEFGAAIEDTLAILYERGLIQVDFLKDRYYLTSAATVELNEHRQDSREESQVNKGHINKPRKYLMVVLKYLLVPILVAVVADVVVRWIRGFME